jgi:hypothetical protein
VLSRLQELSPLQLRVFLHRSPHSQVRVQRLYPQELGACLSSIIVRKKHGAMTGKTNLHGGDGGTMSDFGQQRNRWLAPQGATTVMPPLP